METHTYMYLDTADIDNGELRTSTESRPPAGSAVTPATQCRRPEPILMKQWKYLWPGEPVQLRRGRTVVGTGWVDESTEDASTVWIHLSSGHGRVLIHNSDGIHVWRLNPNLSREGFEG
jgi:hypothetical protein